MSQPPPPKPPRPSQHKTREEATEEFRECLVSFLRLHNPEKLENVEIILDGYYGEEVALVNDLHKKYGSEMSGSEGRQFLYLAGAVQMYSSKDEEYTNNNKTGSESDTAAVHHENPPPKPSTRRKPPPPPGPPPGALPVEEEEDGLPKEAAPAVPSNAPPKPTKPPKPPKPPKPTKIEEGAAGNPFDDDNNSDEDDDEDEAEDGESDAYKRKAIHSFRSKLKEVSIIKEGRLTKLRAKDGSEEMHYFMLKADSLDYIKDHSGNYGDRAKHDMQLLVSNMTGMNMGTDHLEEDLTRSIDLNDILVMPLPESGGAPLDGVPSGRVTITSTNVVASVPDDGRTFRLFTRQKSFFLRASDRASRDAWMALLKETSEKIQQEKRGKLLEPFEVAPIRVIASTKNSCMVCDKEFHGVLGVLKSRHHHCRACGAVVCASCSREKARIPSLDERALFKCCTPCVKELKAVRKYGARRRSII